MTTLRSTITLDQSREATFARVTDFARWEMLAKPAGFTAKPRPQPAPYTVGQVWDVAGKYGKTTTEMVLTLDEVSEGQHIMLSTQVFAIAATVKIAVQVERETGAGTTAVQITADLKPKGITARAMLAPLKLGKTKLEQKVAKVAHQLLKV